MTCEVSFTVDDETAQAIVDGIEEAAKSGEESWEFRGDFTIQEALALRNDLDRQL